MLELFSRKKKSSIPVDQYLSTSALAVALDMERDELFQVLTRARWIERSNGIWALCKRGVAAGGVLYTEEGQSKGWIKWPPEIMEDELFAEFRTERRANAFNATKLGESFGLPADTMNLILAELGWLKKDVRGWVLTENGARLGGQQIEHDQKGYLYVLWPRTLTANRPLRESIKEFLATSMENRASSVSNEEETPKKAESFRSKFLPELRAVDGHFVRSRAEVIIDNYLYMNKILHAYERRLPVEEEAYCDWYLPNGEVYVEYWGMEDDPQYRERKQQKLRIYRSHNLQLIELNDSDMMSLDDALPGKLLKFNIRIR
jgi:hypothetical protein